MLSVHEGYSFQIHNLYSHICGLFSEARVLYLAPIVFLVQERRTTNLEIGRLTKRRHCIQGLLMTMEYR